MRPRVAAPLLAACLVALLARSATPAQQPAPAPEQKPAAAPGSPTAPSAPSATVRAVRGPLEVSTVDDAWQDERRGRLVPVRLHVPKGLQGQEGTGSGPSPVILLSHGLGGTRASLGELAEHWASHGYAVVHLQHPGSDEPAVEAEVKAQGGRREEAMRKLATDPAAGGHRPLDARFALDELARLAAPGGPYAGRIDPSRAGAAGAAFGGWTALALAGQVVVARDGRLVTFADPRVKAAVALAPPPPPRGADLGVVYGSIAVPVLHVTSTRDDHPIGRFRAVERRGAFDHIEGAEQVLVLLSKVETTALTGAGAAGPEREQAEALLREATTAFWDAHLKGDAKARSWLTDGGLANAVGAEGRVEVKRR